MLSPSKTLKLPSTSNTAILADMFTSGPAVQTESDGVDAHDVEEQDCHGMGDDCVMFATAVDFKDADAVSKCGKEDVGE